MEEILEKDRKFIDMIDLKVYHSIFPVKYPPADSVWGRIFRLDDKIISPEKQLIQNFTGTPITIVILLLNGSAKYYDSTGYHQILREKDTLVIGNDKGALQAVTFNFNETEDAEFLEIWIDSELTGKRRQYFPGCVYGDEQADVTAMSPGLGIERFDLTTASWLWRGQFAEGSYHIFKNNSFCDNLILFVINGSITINGRAMNYRDGISLSLAEAITIHFKEETDLLAFQNLSI